MYDNVGVDNNDQQYRFDRVYRMLSDTNTGKLRKWYN